MCVCVCVCVLHSGHFGIYQVTNTLWYHQFMLNPGPLIQAKHAYDYSGISVGLVDPIICVVCKIFSPLFSYLILKINL